MHRLVALCIAALGVIALSAPAVIAQDDSSGEPTLEEDSGGGKPKRTEDYRDTLKDAVADITLFWQATFPDLYGVSYQPIPDSRVFAARPDARLPRCGGQRVTYGDVRGNAYFVGDCPGKPFIIYDDVEKLPQIHRDFGGLAVPVVLAHEFGHAAQDQAGTIDERLILVELQADCFAGSWLARVANGDAPKVPLRSGNLDAALAALLSFADPVGLTEDTDPELAHGSGFDRAAAFQDGFDGGAEACVDYYEEPPPIVEIPFASEEEAASGGNLPAEDVIPAAVDLLNDFYTQVEPAYAAKSIDDIYSFDSTTGDEADLPECGGTTQDEETVRNRVFFCIDDGNFAFDEPYLQHVYDDIGDFGVMTLLANPFATYVQTIQAFPGVEENEDNAVLGADCYTGGFAAAIYNGALLVDPASGASSITLSPGDLDETVLALIDYGRSRLGEEQAASLDVTFVRLRAFRDGFFNGYNTCSSYASSDAAFG